MFEYFKGEYINYFMFVVDVVQKNGLRLDSYFLFYNQYYVMIFGSNLVVGFLKVFVGIYFVIYINFIIVIGGIFFGKVNFEFYVFFIGLLLILVNIVRN